MRILFDHQIFSMQKTGGISRYFVELIKGIGAKEDIEATLSLRYSNNQYVRELKTSQPAFFPSASFKGKSYLNGLVNSYFAKNALKKSEFDIFHPTYYNNYFFDSLGHAKPLVVTVYDCIHEKAPHFFRDAKAVAEQKKRLILKATEVISISEATKEDILQYYEVDSSRVHVVHLASSLTLTSAEPVPGLPKRFILYVGQREGYKNFERFVEASASILKSRNVHLLCVGGGAFSKLEIAKISKIGLFGLVTQMNVSDSQLSLIYSKALLFVCPSLYEGFGIPLIEALSFGCPVLCSDIQVFKEIIGEDAVFFDPERRDSIESSLQSSLEDIQLLKRLSDAGRNRANLFSWSKVVDQTISVYRGTASAAHHSLPPRSS